MLQATQLHIRPGMEDDFEATYARAAELLQHARGYQSHSLTRCVEAPSTYLLLVYWDSLEDHTVHFRQAPDHTEWKAMLDPFYSTKPQSMHFTQLASVASAEGRGRKSNSSSEAHLHTAPLLTVSLGLPAATPSESQPGFDVRSREPE